MKAAVYNTYGPPDFVIGMEDVVKPVPGDNEVLVRVCAASVNPLDGITDGKPYSIRLMTGIRMPKTTRPGVDIAGVVESVGREVKQFKPGDLVFGLCIDDPRARGTATWMHRQGSFAEYACAPESMMVAIPDGITFEQAAAVPVAAITALQGLRDKGRIQPGQRVLINGASGGVGTFAVQIAKWLGAEVTGVCSTRNVDIVRSIGADLVIDYTKENFTENGQRYNVIFDCICNHPLSACRRVINPGGVYIAAGGTGSRWFLGLMARPAQILVMSRFVRQELTVFLARPDREDLVILAELIATGKMTPVIDRHYELSEVGKALRYLQERHARGKVIIEMP